MNKFQVKRSPNKSKPEFSNPEGNCFVVGNGTTRVGHDLSSLMDHGILFGCNYFYREMHPHVLVLSDEAITNTVSKVDKAWCKRNHVFSWYHKPGGIVRKVSFPEKTSAGLMACFEAIESFGAKNIFLVGMDFFGLGSNGKEDNGVVNNIYAGEKHYVPKEAPAPTYRNWQRRFQYILRKYPDVQFWHVDPLDGRSPERLLGAPNWHQTTWEILQDHLKNDAELIDTYNKTPEDESLFVEENPDDVRASIERQFSFQEQVLYPDRINPDEFLKILMQVQSQYLKQNIRQGTLLSIKIKDYDIAVPPLLYESAGGKVLMSLDIIPEWYKQRAHERYIVNKTALKPFKSLQSMNPNIKVDTGMVPPPPPPGLNLDIPPPPPPPVSPPY